MYRIVLAGSCLALLAGQAPALAQESDARTELMTRCAQIESDAARLACFDMAVRGGEAAVRRAAAEARRADPSGALRTGPAAQRPAAGDIAAPEPREGRETGAAAQPEASGFGRGSDRGLSLPGLPSVSLPDLPAFGRNSEQRGADLADAEATSPSQSVPDTEVLARDEDGDPDEVRMVVERISTFGYSTKRFHMTNGQVWEVTDGMRFSVPRNADPLTAEIRTAGAGGYFLRLMGEGRAIRVRRID